MRGFLITPLEIRAAEAVFTLLVGAVVALAVAVRGEDRAAGEYAADLALDEARRLG